MASDIVITLSHTSTDTPSGVAYGKLTGTTAITVALPSQCLWATLRLEPDGGASGTVILDLQPAGADASKLTALASSTATIGTDAGLYTGVFVAGETVIITPALSGADCGWHLTAGR